MSSTLHNHLYTIHCPTFNLAANYGPTQVHSFKLLALQPLYKASRWLQTRQCKGFAEYHQGGHRGCMLTANVAVASLVLSLDMYHLKLSH